MDKLSYTLLNSTTEDFRARQQLTNDLANLSTIGFKRTFSDVSKSLKIEGPGYDTRVQRMVVPEKGISLAPGPRMVTGNPLDISMNDSTVLGVTAQNGDLAFTRRGDMRVNSAGQLEIGTGQKVRGQNGVVSVPPGYAIEIAGDGSVYAKSADKTVVAAQVLVGKLLLRDASATPLERRDDGLFKPAGDNTAGGGDIKDGKATPSITNGSLEGSGVSPFEALTRLLDFSRSFESTMKIIKETKSLDEAGASMMRSA